MSRQVVNPAISVISALCAPCSAAWPGVVFSSSSSQCTPVLSGACADRSARAGASPRPGRSRARPQGSARAAPAASIRSPRISTTAGAIGAPPRPSMSRAALHRDRAARQGSGAEEDSGRGEREEVLHGGAYNTRMPIGTAVHERTFALGESLNYRDWSGYFAVSAYEAHHEHEYNAIRNAAGADRRLAAVQVPRQRPRRRAGWSTASSRATCAKLASARSTTRPGATSTAR